MDEIDKKILNLLLKNATLKYREIAQKLNISTSLAFYRLKKLLNDGTIQRIVPIISDKIAGVDITAIVYVNIEKENLLELERAIAHMRSVCAVYDITGDYDAMIIGKFKNKEGLDHLIKEIRAIKGVTKTNTSLVLNTIKEDFVFGEI